MAYFPRTGDKEKTQKEAFFNSLIVALGLSGGTGQGASTPRPRAQPWWPLTLGWTPHRGLGGGKQGLPEGHPHQSYSEAKFARSAKPDLVKVLPQEGTHPSHHAREPGG